MSTQVSSTLASTGVEVSRSAPWLRTRTGLVHGQVQRSWVPTYSMCRWDGCFIRFLDGMLQTSALGSTDYQLRIPVRLRHVAILDAAPIIPVEGPGKPWASTCMERNEDRLSQTSCLQNESKDKAIVLVQADRRSQLRLRLAGF